MLTGNTDPAWPVSTVPDPLSPTPVRLDPDQGWRWYDQRRRRSHILAAARLVMTQEEFEAVQLRSVARESGVSVQTIYNLIGNRMELMGASASDWVSSIAQAARVEAAEQNLNAPFTLLTMFWSSALTQAAYVESAARTAFLEDTPLARPFQRAGIEEFLSDLRPIQAQGMLRDGVDVTSVARQLMLSAYFTITHWVTERYPVESYRADLVNGPGAILGRVLKGEELRRLERGLAAL